ncbi:hypothetical protein DV738_g303, partial [Chaetothyriales sp. CBS 135597]
MSRRISQRLKREPALKHEEQQSLPTAAPRRQKRGIGSLQQDKEDEKEDSKKGDSKKVDSRKRVKREDGDSDGPLLPDPSLSASGGIKPEPIKAEDEKSAELQSRKLKAYSQYAQQSPFPDFEHPTAEECRLAHRILQKLHGARVRPETVVARPDRAGCGDSPCVLDALVRTILSQNTSDTNSTRAKKSMDQVYGGDSSGNDNDDYWRRIVSGGQAKLQEAIKCGGLSAVKSKVILSILTQTMEKHGRYSLDHLLNSSDATLSNEDAMAELMSFRGVGPKTASCVLLFCLQRDSFAVDTHVHRITGLLGWRPKTATRDETHQHLDVRIPDEDKYGLHVLLVTHGKQCDECKAGGRNLDKCELRRAFKKGMIQDEDVKVEEQPTKQKRTIKAETTVKQERPVRVKEDMSVEEVAVINEVIVKKEIIKEGAAKKKPIKEEQAVKQEEVKTEEEEAIKEEVIVKKEINRGLDKKEAGKGDKVIKNEEDGQAIKEEVIVKKEIKRGVDKNKARNSDKVIKNEEEGQAIKEEVIVKKEVTKSGVKNEEDED